MATETLTDTLRETLALFDAAGTPRTTSEVADGLGLGRRSTYDRLQRLVEHGQLETKKVGASARVWWRPPRSEPTSPATPESLVDEVLDGAEVGVFVLDQAFQIVWANDTVEQYFGIDPDLLAGRDTRVLVEDHIAPSLADPDAFADRVLATYDADAGPEQFECHVTTGESRDARWLEHRSKPIESGTYAGGRVELYYDVTGRKRTERTHRRDREQFESLVAAVEEYAIFMLDTEGYVQTWNPGAEQIKGYAAEEIVGTHFSQFYTEVDRAAHVPERNLAVAARQGSVEDEGWRRRQDGSQFWANVTITAITDEDGTLEGYAKVTRDMTERRRALEEHKLQLSVSQSLASASSLEDGLRTALSHVCEFTDWEVSQAWTPTADGMVERLPVSYAESDADEQFNEASEEFTFTLGEGIPGQVAAMADSVWFTDVSEADEADDARRHLAAEAGVKAGLGVPVIVDGEVAVVLEFYLSEKRSENDWLVEVVTSVAAELGGLVARRQVEDALERERDLLENILDVSPVGIGVFDVDGQPQRMNSRFTELLGQGSAEYSLGERPIFDNTGDLIPYPERPALRTLSTGQPVTGRRVQVASTDGQTLWLSVNAKPLGDDEVVVTMTDVTELERQRQTLEHERDDLESELDTIFERVDDAFYAVDEEYRFTYVNERAEELLEAEEADLLGDRLWDVFPEATETPAWDALQEAMETQEPTSFEVHFDPLEFWVEVNVYPSETGLSVYFHDITERKQFLETLTSLYDSTRELLGAETKAEVSEAVVETATDVLDLSAVVTYLYDEEADCLSPVSQDVDADFTREKLPAVSPDDTSLAGHVYTTGEPCRLDDVTDTSHLRAGAAAGMHTGVFAPVGDHGVLVVGTREADAFNERMNQLVELLAANAEATYDRVARERELARQREQLSALDNLNGVVRDVTDAIIDQSTREEIEQTVCERLAASDSYQFAWVGDVDVSDETVNLRAEAGVEGYIDGITITVDPDDERSDGPTGRALRTGEIQTTQDIQVDSAHDPWREEVETYDFRSSAAIPIVYEGTVYGVLNVYAKRPRAFEGPERAVVGQLGEIVGHAIAAAERKRALLSDDVVELEFRIPDVFETLGGDVTLGGSISLDHVVPVGNEEYLVYGRASEDAVDSVSALVQAIDHWSDLTFQTDEGTRQFHLRLSESPVLSAIASLGGVVDHAVIEDGDYRMRIHLSPGVEVRQVTELVQETYPQADLLKRHQVSRQTEQPDVVDHVLSTTLTERQRTALEVAYYAGFFEWPRDATGEELAEALGIAPPTFSQHLRKAQQKVYESLLGTPSVAT